MSKLSKLLQSRDDYWAEDFLPLHNIIFDKTALAASAASMGWPVPKNLSIIESLRDIPYSSLPSRFVVKPNNNWSCNGVLLIRDGCELLTGDHFSNVVDYVTQRMGVGYINGGENLPPPKSYVIEEMVEDYNPLVLIPRDFKVYSVRGKNKLVQVIDRNVKLNGAYAASAYWVDGWRRTIIGNGETYEGIDLVPEPPPQALLHSLYDLTSSVSSNIGAAVRVDCYLTSNGALLGEITSSPGGGNTVNYEFSRSFLRWISKDQVCTHWRT